MSRRSRSLSSTRSLPNRAAVTPSTPNPTPPQQDQPKRDRSLNRPSTSLRPRSSAPSSVIVQAPSIPPLLSDSTSTDHPTPPPPVRARSKSRMVSPMRPLRVRDLTPEMENILQHLPSNCLQVLPAFAFPPILSLPLSVAQLVVHIMLRNSSIVQNRNNLITHRSKGGASASPLAQQNAAVIAKFEQHRRFIYALNRLRQKAFTEQRATTAESGESGSDDDDDPIC